MTDTPTFTNVLSVQGYVPAKCTMHAELAMVLFMAEMLRDPTYDPCSGCNMDRAACGGRPKRAQPEPGGSWCEQVPEVDV